MKLLVVWRGDEAEFYQSCVEIGITDPQEYTAPDLVFLAALSEGYSEAAANCLTESGYDFILAVPMPEAFYGGV